MSAVRPTHTEGPVAKTIEQQTAKLPSDWILWAALFLILGVYNKLVKQLGSDGVARAAA